MSLTHIPVFFDYAGVTEVPDVIQSLNFFVSHAFIGYWPILNRITIKARLLCSWFDYRSELRLHKPAYFETFLSPPREIS
jgi:hypothetical protein